MFTRLARNRLMLAGLTLTLAATGCDALDPAPARAPEPSPVPEIGLQVAASFDGVLRVVAPDDLLVHRQNRAILATAAGGEVRLYVSHQPDDALIRLAGAAKDTLHARGWELGSEKHYEQATEQRWFRDNSDATGRESRVVWVIRRGGRAVTCDAIADPGFEARLGDPLRALCQSVTVTPPPELAPAEPEGAGRPPEAAGNPIGATPRPAMDNAVPQSPPAPSPSAP